MNQELITDKNQEPALVGSKEREGLLIMAGEIERRVREAEINYAKHTSSLSSAVEKAITEVIQPWLLKSELIKEARNEIEKAALPTSFQITRGISYWHPEILLKLADQYAQDQEKDTFFLRRANSIRSSDRELWLDLCCGPENFQALFGLGGPPTALHIVHRVTPKIGYSADPSFVTRGIEINDLIKGRDTVAPEIWVEVARQVEAGICDKKIREYLDSKKIDTKAGVNFILADINQATVGYPIRYGYTLAFVGSIYEYGRIKDFSHLNDNKGTVELTLTDTKGVRADWVSDSGDINAVNYQDLKRMHCPGWLWIKIVSEEEFARLKVS